MKIALLLPPHSLEDRYNKYMAKAGGFFPPLGILYLASYLRKKNHEVIVIDGTFVNRKDMLGKITEFNPDVVGITTFTFLWSITKRVIEDIKTRFPNVFIVLGGPHATSDSMNCFSECDYFDALVHGEGEETMVELMKALKNKAPMTRHPKQS